jgi:Phage integrase, N-terminal SAM-like domain
VLGAGATGGLTVEPLDRRISWRQATAREVLDHWSHARTDSSGRPGGRAAQPRRGRDDVTAPGEPPIHGQLDVEQVLELVRCEQPPPASAAVRGELIASAAELAERFTDTLLARPQTQRTYRRACARCLRWLGPLLGPADLTAANVARYHAHLVAGGRSSATVKKDRAALNSFPRWLGARARARRPGPGGVGRPAAARGERPAGAAQGTEREQYERLLREAKARMADDPVAGAPDLAIVLPC